MDGWIKLSRGINEHWIWKDPVKLKWWLDMLITVNYEPKKIPIGYKIFECGRGESLLSLQSWGKRWGVSKTVVNNFFIMLENDKMIQIKNETVTTRIIICNYASYQSFENESKTQRKRNSTATVPQQSTTKEREEREERKEEYINTWRDDYKIYIDDLRKAYSEIIKDSLWIDEKQKYYPKLNIILSLEKSCKEYWATEAGWKKKKASKSNELDWKRTFTNALSLTSNKVYNNEQQIPKSTKTDY